MEHLTVEKLYGIPSEYEDTLFEAMRNRSNKERLAVCLFFMSELSDQSLYLDQIEEQLKKIFPPSKGQGLKPSDYADFQASAIRGQFNNETKAVEEGEKRRSDRLWKNVGDGCWRNTENSREIALRVLAEEGIIVRVRGERIQ